MTNEYLRTEYVKNYDIYFNRNSIMNIKWDVDKDEKEPYFGTGKTLELGLSLFKNDENNFFLSLENFVTFIQEKLNLISALQLTLIYNELTKKFEITFGENSTAKAVRFETITGFSNVFIDVCKFKENEWIEPVESKNNIRDKCKFYK